MTKGFLITFEGPEGSGKSTHSALVADYLKRKGYTVRHTREPGGTALAEVLRKVILNPDNNIAPLTELLLYEAGRAQHTSELLMPALAEGTIVICDRYVDATLAYQGYGRGIPLAIIRRLNVIAAQNVMPDLTILLDIASGKGLKTARMLNKDSFLSGDRLEREDVSFHRKVRKGYLLLAKEDPKRIKVIRTGKSIEETHARVIAVVERALRKPGPGTPCHSTISSARKKQKRSSADS